ncbi:thyrotropin-releasing hormone receptor [Biomphalaria pfeifferi]|uniref:Thyrotropin-releasing hormone receptor n=1 Tax=Biomphalaria pfeifferi TaxID=112525 RepID=A0AAD8B347_BIOPF|nr:thyrotropin-releasing hormone receptor [Biomphalaria pfeifferi]
MTPKDFNSSYPLSTFSPEEFQDFVISIFDLVFTCGLFHILNVSGVVTNGMNILVLTKYGLHDTTTLLQFSLSVSDLFCSILLPFRRLHCIVSQYEPLLAISIQSFTHVYLSSLPDFFICISLLHTTIIAVERLVAVCLPLKMSMIFTTSRVKWLLLFIYIYVVVLIAPTLFLVEISWIVDPSTNKTIATIVISKLYSKNLDIFNQYMYLGLSHVLSTSTLSISIGCSIVIGYKITVRRKTILSQLSPCVSQKVKDVKVIKMLLTVCVVNSFVSFPTLAMNMYIYYSNTFIQSSGKLYLLIRGFFFILCQLKISFNFILYIFMSSKFNATLNQIYHCRNNKNKK